MDRHRMGSILFGQTLYSPEVIQQKTDNIKKLLLNCGVDEKDVIAVMLPRTEMLIVSMLALLELEITFVPVSAELPEERRKFMLENAGVSAILTVSEYEPGLSGYPLIFPEQSGQNEEGINRKFGSETAYIMYTSGTTGKPKGVEVKRKGLDSFLEGISHAVSFPQSGRISCFTEYTFDIFFLESIWALKEGLTVVLADDWEKNNPKRMLSLIQEHHINILQMTPSRMRLLEMVDPQLAFLQETETIMVGGEPFPEELLKKMQKYDKLRIYNMYGPTETTIWSMVSDLTGVDKVTLGQPIRGTRIYLMTNDFQMIRQEGETGEICIGGAGVAQGYRNDAIQTSEHFKYLPFEPCERVYLTGDLGQYDEKGRLLYCGRRDSQIKLRGHRIELQDIENNILRVPEIQLAAACYDKESQRVIVFYLSHKEIFSYQLYEHMTRCVPDYMIPGKFVRVPKLVYTPSGKVDRNALLRKWKDNYNGENEVQNTCMGQQEADFSSGQTIIINLLRMQLGEYEREINSETCLKTLGLDSLAYMKFLIDVEDSFHMEFEEEVLPLGFFDTLHSLTDYVKEKVGGRIHGE